MAFDSLQAFWLMEGHGPYVWTCYGAFLAGLVGLALWSRHRRKVVIREQQRQLARDRQDQGESTPAAAATFSRIHPS